MGLSSAHPNTHDYRLRVSRLQPEFEQAGDNLVWPGEIAPRAAVSPSAQQTCPLMARYGTLVI